MDKILEGDCLEVMRGMEENSVEAVVCDPPYELTSIVKRFGKKGSAPPKQGTDGRYARLSKGFMGKTWDGTGIAMRPEVWEECLRVAKPGAYLLAFGGTRTFHRLACAIEDAGWILKDTLSWNYGSGFPKSHDISKALDKHRRRDFINAAMELGLIIPGNSMHDWMKGEHAPSDKWWEKFKEALSPEQWESIERKVIGKDTKARSAAGKSAVPTLGTSVKYETWNITAPATPEAKQWSGFGTALKPAWEPIILAQAPLEGTYAENVLKWGCGALNIDACRIGASEPIASHHGTGRGMFGNETDPYKKGDAGKYTQKKGRWPANFLVSHTMFCEKVGEKRVRAEKHSGKPGTGKISTFGMRMTGETKCYADPDGLETVEDWRCVPNCPVRMLDAQSGERAGCKPHHVRASQATAEAGKQKGWGNMNAMDKFTGYDDQGGASRFFYCAKASRRERNAGLSAEHNLFIKREEKKSDHPTMKPVALMRYLCRLVTPPNGLVLDPFAGSGSTGCAAALEGFESISIEKEKGYAEIARARIAHFSQGKP